MTPIVKGSEVTLKIQKVEVSGEVRTTATATERFPVINRRDVSTTVKVADGETMVIGGLVQRREVNRLNKIPGLGDVPVLGNLFRRIDRQEEESEVAIFITPRLVKEESRS